MYQLLDPGIIPGLMKDGSTVAIGGGGAGHAVPDKVLHSLGELFRQTGHPRDLTIIHPCGIGDNDARGLNHLAHEGLVKMAMGGFWGNAPKMVQLAVENRITGYNLPQGVLSHLMRAIAAGTPGVITHVGLSTFQSWTALFSHRPKMQLHYDWYNELYRILKPKGIMFLTSQGDNYRVKLTESELKRHNDNRLVVRGNVKEGHRTYSAFHPKGFMRKLFNNVEILEHIETQPEKGKWLPQDIWIVKK